MRISRLIVLYALVAAVPAAAQSGSISTRPLPYRVGFGVVPTGRVAPGGVGISTSVDVYAPTASRLALRLDATVVSNRPRSSMAAATLDAAYRIPVWRVAAYPIVGAGVTGDIGWTAVGGGGVDFIARGRAMFSEFRMYGDRGDMLMKLGFRF